MTTNLCASSLGAATGYLQSDADSCQIKFVELRGSYTLAPLARLSNQIAALTPVRVRRMVVWWYKYPTNVFPTSSRVCPGTTEGLVIPDSENAGSFKVLSDKMFELGTNVYTVDPAATTNVTTICQNGKVRVDFVEKVIVNKSQHYFEPPTSASKGGGWGTSGAGVVSRGLLVMYHIYEGDAGTLTSVCKSRVTYVG